MYAKVQANDAYGKFNPALQSDSETEYKIFATITAELNKFKNASALHFSDLATAVDRNRRLWTLLAADVASPQNQLPASLRAQIFYLFEFTVQHSAAVLDGKASVEPLVDINRTIMRGLSGKVEVAQ